MLAERLGPVKACFTEAPGHATALAQRPIPGWRHPDCARCLLEDGLADITLLERVSLAEVAANLAIRLSTADGSYRYCCTSRLKIALFGHCASPITIFVGFASAKPIVRSGTRTSKKCSAA